MKKKNKISFCEEKANELSAQVREAKHRLMDKVENVICKQGVINLYPNGADKDRAIKDLEEAQEQLHWVIGYYDERKAELIQYLKQYNTELKHYAMPSDSHSIIEITYRNFFKR